MPSIEEKKATGGPKLYVSDHLSTSSLIIILPFLPLFLSQLCNHGNLLLKTMCKVWAPGGSQGQGEDMSPTPDIWAALTRIIEESMKTFCHEYGYFATGSLSNIQNVYLSVVPHLHNSTFFHSQDLDWLCVHRNHCQSFPYDPTLFINHCVHWASKRQMCFSWQCILIH